VAGLRRLGTARTSAPGVRRKVTAILRAVEREGDRAVARYARRFDGARFGPKALKATPREVRSLAQRASRALRTALADMAARIEAYHRRQLDDGFRLETDDGSILEEVVRPLERVALYVPGGAGAYPSSVLMNAIPARVAGVPRIQVMTPPRQLEVSPAVAAALVLMGLEDAVYRVGGAQAIAACAYGTETVPRVAKIVGPGNAYVTEAKRQVRGEVEIDHEAGPSEIVVLADDSADAGWVAADLVAQAEHGSGQELALLVTTSPRLAKEVARLVDEGVASAANVAAARRVLGKGTILLVKDLEQGVAAVNELAPEHVEVMTRRASDVARRLVAGAVFVGPYSPVAAGDYGIGPNHVLPTGGAARFSSPLSVRDFQRRQSLVRVTRAGLAAASFGMVQVAMAEGFPGHAQSVLTRFEG
jgi:histidinol dehydrogenase